MVIDGLGGIIGGTTALTVAALLVALGLATVLALRMRRSRLRPLAADTSCGSSQSR
ncbi:hypothetical protein [Nocardia abscessus]|uniref:LPXTG cell wall anchor domain-containing protein n=1 Tax=Nocardia abscessus TaxID=120957 RepID=A0ABS0C9M9_9NOCA|nr:hypothetical protein [Nocardia abscessus]MBF6225118.1 hypothetical protein [Nocardia abscessus]